MEKKLGTSVEALCKGFPSEFVTYLVYCKNIRFDEKPDYVYLKNLFKDLFQKSNFEFDYLYDWNILAQEKKKENKDGTEITDAKPAVGAAMNSSIPINSTQMKSTGIIGTTSKDEMKPEAKPLDKEVKGAKKRKKIVH